MDSDQPSFTCCRVRQPEAGLAPRAVLGHDELHDPVDPVVALIEPYYYSDRPGKRGRKAKPVELMLRMYLPQVWFSLADEGMEDAVYIGGILVFPLAVRARDNVRPGMRTSTVKKRTLVAYQVEESSGELVVNILGVLQGGQDWEAAQRGPGRPGGRSVTRLSVANVAGRSIATVERVALPLVLLNRHVSAGQWPARWLRITRSLVIAAILFTTHGGHSRSNRSLSILCNLMSQQIGNPIANSISVRSLPDVVATYVRELILTGELRPGEFLRLTPIAKAVGVSNTPAREALLTLSSEGFVELVPRRGFRVRRLSQRDLRDAFWVQAKLAGELAARAAKVITPEQVAELDQLREEYESAVKSGDEDRIADSGHDFHRYVNYLADSDRLAGILGSIVQQVPNRLYATVEGQIQTTFDDHSKIVEAMRENSPRTARKLAEEHILDQLEHLIGLLGKRDLWQRAETV